MTVLDYLKDKIVCPVCNEEISVDGLRIAEFPKLLDCVEARSDLQIVAAWLVLTGGPIPGSVKPPMPMWRRDVKADYIGPYYSHTSWFEDETNLYMLTADERTIEIITEWLQRPMGEGV